MTITNNPSVIHPSAMEYFCLTSENDKVDRDILSDGIFLKKDDTRAAGTSTTDDTHFMLSADLKDSVAFEIGYSVPEVQAVFARFRENGVLHVWAVVPEHDRTIYRSIYTKEKQLINQFKGIDFDFNVVPSRGRDPRALISDPDIQLTYLRK